MWFPRSSKYPENVPQTIEYIYIYNVYVITFFLRKLQILAEIPVYLHRSSQQLPLRSIPQAACVSSARQGNDGLTHHIVGRGRLLGSVETMGKSWDHDGQMMGKWWSPTKPVFFEGISNMTGMGLNRIETLELNGLNQSTNRSNLISEHVLGCGACGSWPYPNDSYCGSGR